MNKLYKVIYNDATWEEDDSLLISAKNLDECKQLALSNDWNISWDEERHVELMEAIKNFKEEDLNKRDYDAVIQIHEVENKSGILHISNKGA